MQDGTKNKTLAERYIDALADIKEIKLEKQDTFQKYYYRGINDLFRIRDSLIANKIVFSIEELQVTKDERVTKEKKEVEYTATAVFLFSDAFGIDKPIRQMAVGTAIDNRDKGAGKLMASLMKCLFYVMMIPTEETGSSDAENAGNILDNIKLCGTVGELNELFKVSSQAEKLKYKDEFKSRKVEILG